MNSLFFDAGDRRCVVREESPVPGLVLRRLDVAGGLVMMETQGTLPEPFRRRVENWDRMLVLPLVSSGSVRIDTFDHTVEIGAGVGGVLAAGPSEIRVECSGERHRSATLFVADFFLRRYRQEADDPVSRLVETTDAVRGVRILGIDPLDRLGDYLLDRIGRASRRTRLSRLATEHRVLELLLHRLDLLEWERDDPELGSEELRVSSRAREILLRRYADPPTIPELARLCRSNEWLLKRAFKRRYGMTIHRFVTLRRLEEANRLLRSGELRVGEVARRVGYRHAGHFSRLFFDHYGIHPKAARPFG
ncbi:helix-turn-helix transcriptional regulator [Nitratifractor sp.]